jgi:hypothetical protein
MNSDGQFIASFQAGEIEQGRIENYALRIADFRNGFGHDVILCFTARACKNRRRVASVRV